MFFKKATKFDEIFTVDLTLCSKCQIDGEDFIDFCGLLRKHELHDNISKCFVTLRSNFKLFLKFCQTLVAFLEYMNFIQDGSKTF